MTPRYQWTPASEPPDDDRDVLVWITKNGRWKQWAEGYYMPGIQCWSCRNVMYWRDVEAPPCEQHDWQIVDASVMYEEFRCSKCGKTKLDYWE